MCSGSGVVVVGGSGSGGSSRVSGSGSAVVVVVTNIVPVWAANMTRAVMRARMSEDTSVRKNKCALCETNKTSKTLWQCV